MTDDAELFRFLADVEAKPIEWLWEPYIPHEMITILEGDPGIGKSYLAMHLAAQITSGGSLPGRPKLRPGRVLYLTAEDDPAYTLRPRIEAMGGNARRIRFVDGFLAFDELGLRCLEKELEKQSPDLIVADTLFAFIPSGKDPFKPNDIRQVLSAVGRIASTCGAAVLMIRHWTKDTRGKALYRGSGSIDIIGVARSAVMVSVHPEDADLRVIAHVKHNLSRRGVSHVFALPHELGNGQPILQWRGTTHLTADDLQSDATEETRTVDEVADFVRQQLRDGRKSATAIKTAAEARCHSLRTLDRAKKALGVRSEKVGREWFWVLPTTPES